MFASRRYWAPGWQSDAQGLWSDLLPVSRCRLLRPLPLAHTDSCPNLHPSTDLDHQARYHYRLSFPQSRLVHARGAQCRERTSDSPASGWRENASGESLHRRTDDLLGCPAEIVVRILARRHSATQTYRQLTPRPSLRRELCPHNYRSLGI